MRSENSQYEIIQELGSGSFGTVYYAISLSDGEPVAIKVFFEAEYAEKEF